MITEKIKSTMKDAALKLTGSKKRAFMAQVTIDYLNSSSRKAETQLGWSRKAIATGLKELETGIVGLDNYRARGRKKTEELRPQLEITIRLLQLEFSELYLFSISKLVANLVDVIHRSQYVLLNIQLAEENRFEDNFCQRFR